MCDSHHPCKTSARKSSTIKSLGKLTLDTRNSYVRVNDLDGEMLQEARALPVQGSELGSPEPMSESTVQPGMVVQTCDPNCTEG